MGCLKTIKFVVVVGYCITLVATMELVVLHTNDIHARFRQANENGGVCSEEDAEQQLCYGGVARIVSKVKEIRRSEENVLVLDGGDQYQGTLWFYHYKGKAAAHFTQMINYSAMALGNHEFDNGIEGLVPFLENVTFPVVSSNIDASAEPTMQGLFSKSTTVTLPGGGVVGIVGYTTADAPSLSETGGLIFNSEIESIREEVEKLKSQGINKIIAVGHAGIGVDQQIAEQVDGIDIVVGGHTNTFLYTGEPPSVEKPYGEYPLVRHPVTDPEKNVLVVQDYAYGKYLGHLTVTFNEAGDITSWNGNPILLDKTVEQDPETLEDIEEWAKPIKEMDSRVIGKTHVFLDGRRMVCRLEECNLGNVVADSMVHQNMKHPDEARWSDVSIAVVGSGGIRSSIEGPKSITVGEVLNVLPFRNTLDLVEVYGSTIWKMLEHSVSEYSPPDPSGTFIHMSGLLVTYDMSKAAGQRVVKVDVKCTECSVPEYLPLESATIYKMVVPAFLANGGDGYTMLEEEKLVHHIPGDLDTDVLIEYIEAHSPITTGVERRITFVDPDIPCVSAGQHP